MPIIIDLRFTCKLLCDVQHIWPLLGLCYISFRTNSRIYSLINLCPERNIINSTMGGRFAYNLCTMHGFCMHVFWPYALRYHGCCCLVVWVCCKIEVIYMCLWYLLKMKSCAGVGYRWMQQELKRCLPSATWSGLLTTENKITILIADEWNYCTEHCKFIVQLPMKIFSEKWRENKTVCMFSFFFLLAWKRSVG